MKNNNTQDTPPVKNDAANRGRKFSLTQTAIQIKQPTPRAARTKGGSPRKSVVGEKGTVIIQPAQFMLDVRRRPIQNRGTHLYITPDVETALIEAANTLANKGCVINTQNKMLSLVCATSDFKKLIDKVTNDILRIRSRYEQGELDTPQDDD